MHCMSSSPSAIDMSKCACITFGVWLHWACLQPPQTQLHVILLPTIPIQPSITNFHPHMIPRSIFLILHYINLNLLQLMILANTPTLFIHYSLITLSKLILWCKCSNYPIIEVSFHSIIFRLAVKLVLHVCLAHYRTESPKLT